MASQTSGYSGTPLVRKLGVKAGHRVALVGAPPGFEVLLAGLPAKVKLARSLRGTKPWDVIVHFATIWAQLERDAPKSIARLDQSGGLWFAWPKKAAKVATDVSETRIRELILRHGLVDNKVCAIDETWSGLRAVVRVKNRADR